MLLILILTGSSGSDEDLIYILDSRTTGWDGLRARSSSIGGILSTGLR